MFLKILFFTFFSFCGLNIKTISSDPNLVRSREQDANQAYGDFMTFKGQEMSKLYMEISNNRWEKIHQLEMMDAETSHTIDRKVNDIRWKIQQIKKMLDDLGITRCAYESDTARVEEYATEQADRAKECTERTTEVIDNMIKETTAEINLMNNHWGSCYGRSLAYCRYYHINDTCFDFLISNIETAKINVGTAFRLMKLNFINKIITFKLPCQDLIDFELSVYPDYAVENLKQCAEVALKNKRPNSCPDVNLQ